MKIRFFATIALFCMGIASAMAQTLTVTSPTEGDFIGLTNTINFNITGATVEVRVDVVATGPGGVQFTATGNFQPSPPNPIINSLALNFSQGVPEGAYTIVVTATEPGNTYAPVTRNVTLDVTKPKLLQANPITNAFVRGIVPIRVKVLEPNFKDYRVQVDGQDIPNNTGTVLDPNGEFVVNWDTTGIEFDGAKDISIRLRDQADNEFTKTVTLTLDRNAPVIAIVQPRADVMLAARSNVSIIIDFTDLAGNSIHVGGVDVIARTMTGQYIGRASLNSFRGIGASSMRWTGRIRYRSSLPKTFKLIVTATDRAGNVAVPQEVIVRYR